jgi:hypothetical protein
MKIFLIDDAGIYHPFQPLDLGGSMRRAVSFLKGVGTSEGKRRMSIEWLG